MKIFISIGIYLSLAIVYAADIPLEFEDAAQQQRYQQLLDELRCLVCQNQTLADSHADLAQDLRSQVYGMVSDGQTNQVIVDYLVTRYGNFVLYRPPLNPYTVLLWFGPFILLLFALIVVYRLANSKKVVDVKLNQEDHLAVSKLLNQSDSSNHS
ncbi:MAG: cytochrome c-type biogenesis protein CcmH [Gammaproteobacteria bacterium]|jgi:cytochrome c-type biogenesis protein CcmH